MPPGKWRKRSLKIELILFTGLLIFLSSCGFTPPEKKIISVKNYLSLNTGRAPARIKGTIIKQNHEPADTAPAMMFIITGLSAESPPPAKTDKACRLVFSPEILKRKIKAALPEKTKPKFIINLNSGSVKKQNSELTIYFNFDSSIISKKEIIKLNKFIKNNLSVRHQVQIKGYASQSGSATYNQALSLKRALSVKKYLVGQNIRNTTAIGLGEIKVPQTKLSRKAVISISKKEGLL